MGRSEQEEATSLRNKKADFSKREYLLVLNMQRKYIRTGHGRAIGLEAMTAKGKT